MSSKKPGPPETRPNRSAAISVQYRVTGSDESLVLPGRRGIRARHKQNRGFQYRRPVQAATCFWMESGEIGSSLLTEGSIRLS